MKVEIKIPEHAIIEASDQGVTITRKGLRSFGNRGSNGAQFIPYTSIIGINFKPAAGPAGISGGHIDFQTAGGNQSTSGFGSLLGGGSDYSKANSVVFRSHNDEMEALRDYVQKKALAAHQPQQSVIQRSSAADELKKFKALLDDGVITQTEFDAKKKQILGL